MRGLTMAVATALKADMIPPWVQNAAQHQRDIAMNYYMKATEIADFAEKQTVHKKYLRILADAIVEYRRYQYHIRIADRLVRT